LKKDVFCVQEAEEYADLQADKVGPLLPVALALVNVKVENGYKPVDGTGPIMVFALIIQLFVTMLM
jgi:short subunit dehydrogenase-like uncharacterized protein